MKLSIDHVIDYYGITIRTKGTYDVEKMVGAEVDLHSLLTVKSGNELMTDGRDLDKTVVVVEARKVVDYTSGDVIGKLKILDKDDISSFIKTLDSISDCLIGEAKKHKENDADKNIAEAAQSIKIAVHKLKLVD